MHHSTHGPLLSSAVELGVLGGGKSLIDSGTAAATHGLLMVMLIEIASVLCHSVSQEAVDMH